ncbi:MAG: glycerol-3-phosphate dehydrogenase/oxidase [Actinobacteria bacterium]|nr:glycerol-3-phosphate dehydrogenase/oxidase [Actinomycetota bacterium]
MSSHSLPTVAPGAPASMLSPDRRLRDCEHLAEHVVDVVVIGGGITGAGVALDAATRGLDVALVEANDLAYGTSRWSSKLVHGGLRYLASGQVGVAWESAVERERLMSAIAPHLTHPLAQVLPYGDRFERRLVAVGLRAADAMRRATGSHLAPPRGLDTREALNLVPGMRQDVAGAALSWDGQLVDDARLVVAVARTAAAYGAHILTHTRVIDVVADGVTVVDTLTGESWLLRAQRVVNATGAWASGLDDRVRLVRSRGTHLVVSAESLGHPTAALAVPVPGSHSRFVFALPEPDGLVFIGLTDVESDDDIDHPRADEEEVDFLLDTINTGLARPLGRDDILSTFSGYRPLLAPAGESGTSADLSRRHAVLDGHPISVVGGKLTTYRRMASDVVDLLTDRECRTRRLPLVGAAPWQDGADRLRTRFGAEADLVASLAEGDNSLLQPIANTPVLPVELLWARLAEGAVTESDVLDRRLRLDLMPRWRRQVAEAGIDLEIRLLPNA